MASQQLKNVLVNMLGPDLALELLAFAPNATCTSQASLAIANGVSKTFTVPGVLPFAPGHRVRASNAADPSAFMEGIVTSYAGRSLTMISDTKGGSGTVSNWILTRVANLPAPLVDSAFKGSIDVLNRRLLGPNGSIIYVDWAQGQWNDESGLQAINPLQRSLTAEDGATICGSWDLGDGNGRFIANAGLSIGYGATIRYFDFTELTLNMSPILPGGVGTQTIVLDSDGFELGANEGDQLVLTPSLALEATLTNHAYTLNAFVPHSANAYTISIVNHHTASITPVGNIGVQRWGQ